MSSLPTIPEDPTNNVAEPPILSPKELNGFHVVIVQGTTYSGIWKNGRFSRGKITKSPTHYLDGSFDDEEKLHGNGRLVEGQEERSGMWEHGIFKQGTRKLYLENWSGRFKGYDLYGDNCRYSGPISEAEGTFERAALIEGTLLWKEHGTLFTGKFDQNHENFTGVIQYSGSRSTITGSFELRNYEISRIYEVKSPHFGLDMETWSECEVLVYVWSLNKNIYEKIITTNSFIHGTDLWKTDDEHLLPLVDSWKQKLESNKPKKNSPEKKTSGELD